MPATALPPSLDLIDAVGSDDAGATAASTLLTRLGWRGGQVRAWPARGTTRVVELFAAGESQAVLVLSPKPSEPRAVSLSYSREAAYTVTWTPDRLRVSRTTRWNAEPGDSALIDASVHDRHEIYAAIATLNRDDVLDRSLDQLAPGAIEHPELARKLAEELAALRGRIAESQVYAGMGAEATDLAVLRLFHRLLYVRVAEDRGSLGASMTIAQLAGSDDPIAGAADLLTRCSQQLNSELFERPVELLEHVPPASLVRLLVALSEPWSKLRLDFSIARTELASRLYETYLGLLPVEESDSRQRLFRTVATTDRRSHQASYYTPAALADVLVDRVLSAWAAVARPCRFQDVKFLDPACGSGTFLCSAYAWLRTYFEREFGEELSSEQRAELLTTCILGVDLDERSLGLAQVQLLELAQLDGRLPPMADNLLHGDAVGAPPGSRGSDQDIDWDAVIANVGRPTCVVTNPPFLSEGRRRLVLGADRVAHLDHIYADVRSKGADHAYLFVSLASRLLNGTGASGFVLPRQVLDGDSGAKARTVLLDQGLHWVADLRTVRVFSDVDVGVCAVGACHGADVTAVRLQTARDYRSDPRRVVDALADVDDDRELLEVLEPRDVLRDRLRQGWAPLRMRQAELIAQELEQASTVLGEHATITQGVKPSGATRIKAPRIDRVRAGIVHVDGLKVPERYLPRLVIGSDVLPFLVRQSGERILLPYEDDRAVTSHPDVTGLIDRIGGVPANYRYGNLKVLRAPKVLVRTVTDEPAAAADTRGNVVPIVRGAHAVGFLDVDAGHLPGIAALLNSAVYQWLLRTSGTPRQQGFIELVDRDLRQLPWPVLSTSNLDTLTTYAADVGEALEHGDSIERAGGIRAVRRKIDDLAFDLLGASTRLRQTVRAELMRTA